MRFLLAGALFAGVVAGGAAWHPTAAPAQDRETRDGAVRDADVVEVASLRTRRLSAMQAAAEIARGGRVPAQETAQLMVFAEYPAREVTAALMRIYSVAEPEAARFVEATLPAEAIRSSAGARAGIGRDAAMRADICFDARGALFVCPQAVAPAVVQPGPYAGVDWSVLELSPSNDAEAGAELVIRSPAPLTLPAAQVRLGGVALAPVSASESELRVRLPDETVTGELRMSHADLDADVVLASKYRVRASGFLDELDTITTGHSWENSYLFGLLSYYIYSDTLGDPSNAKQAFEQLVAGWGMEVVGYGEHTERHLLAAVLVGPEAVVVVFRGSEDHATAHCFIKVHFATFCPHLSANWVDNFQFAPLRHRPEWGEHFRTHRGIDTANDLVFAKTLAVAKAATTGGRRLFVTGHSLGGAMATLFAYRATFKENLHVHTVYTYGAPRVVNIPFTGAYDALLGSRIHRWQNRSDPIPGLPPGQPIQFGGLLPPVSWETYRHIGRLNYLPAAGAPEIDAGGESFQLPSSAAQLATSDHYMAASPDSYIIRMRPHLPTAVRARMPCPPGYTGSPPDC